MLFTDRLHLALPASRKREMLRRCVHLPLPPGPSGRRRYAEFVGRSTSIGGSSGAAGATGIGCFDSAAAPRGSTTGTRLSGVDGPTSPSSPVVVPAATPDGSTAGGRCVGPSPSARRRSSGADMSRSLPSAITVQARLPCTRRSGCGGPCHDRELGSGSGEATARVWPSHEPAPVRGVGQREIVFGFARPSHNSSPRRVRRPAPR